MPLQGVKRGHWSQLRYRGDTLRRPIASYELAPLVRLLVRASEAANARMRLGTPAAADEPALEGPLQVLCCTSFIVNAWTNNPSSLFDEDMIREHAALVVAPV